MIRRSKKAPTVAVLAAILALVLHTILAGGAAAAASMPAFDPFGNPICAAARDNIPSAPGLPADHRHLPDCCLAGCAVGGGAALPAAVAIFIVPRASPLAARPAAARDVGALSGHSPLLPRGPPRRS